MLILFAGVHPSIKVKLGLLVLFSAVMLVAVRGSAWVGAARVGAALGNVTGRTLPAVSALAGVRVAQLDTVLLTATIHDVAESTRSARSRRATRAARSTRSGVRRRRSP